MLFSTLTTLASLAGLALAAPATVDRSASIVKRGDYGYDERTVHKVTVGKGKLRYDPQFVHATKGDVVLFEFFAMNHTLSQSSFEDPCTKQTNKFGQQTGIDSAFNFATKSNDGKNQPVFAFSVEDDSKPLWFYCRQTVPVSHCNDGMVFAINPPPKGNTFDAFQKKAQALGKKDKGKKHGDKKYDDKKDKKYDDGQWDEKKYGWEKYEHKYDDGKYKPEKYDGHRA